MKTELLPATGENIALAASLLRGGGVVAMPTETVYGLAADAFSGEAVARIFESKGRPQDNPLIVHIAEAEDLGLVARELPKEALALAEAFWPGPLTLVLPRQSRLAAGVSAGLDTVGVRLPAHPAARALIRAAGMPLAAPSANLSGSPSPTTARHVRADLDGRIPLILDGGNSPVGVESTVLSLAGEPTVLRPGFVTAEEIAEALGCPVALSPYIGRAPDENLRPESPGMKYRHYAPRAEITIIDGDYSRYNLILSKIILNSDRALQAPIYALCFEGEEAGLPLPAVCFGRAGDAASQAAALFDALRRLDALGAKTVYARMPGGSGQALAVRNRLLRAAGFRVMGAK